MKEILLEILKEYPKAKQDELDYYFDQYVRRSKLNIDKIKKLKYYGKKGIDKSN